MLRLRIDRAFFSASAIVVASSLAFQAGISRGEDVLDLVNPFEASFDDAPTDSTVGEVELVQATQPASPSTAPPATPRSNVRSAAFSSRRSRRLVRAPHMIGDSGGRSAIAISGDGGIDTFTSDVPLAGTNRVMKASENNRALTDNRIYFMYNHFHSAINIESSGGTIRPQRPAVDRYTFGFEKTIGPCWSVELRMPFTNDYNHSSNAFAIEGGQVGDLSIFVKRMIHESDTCAAVLGLGINTPTGSDVTGIFPLTTTRFEVRNEAVHLSPVLGLLATPNNRLFFHSWFQVDVPTNGHEVFAQDILIPTDVGRARFREQVLMHFDLAGGFWLCKTPSRRRPTGVAALVEFHYTTALEDTEVVNLSAVPADPLFFRDGNRVDIPNLTLGLHAALNQDLAVRFGGAFPLERAPDRLFAAEFMLSVIRVF